MTATSAVVLFCAVFSAVRCFGFIPTAIVVTESIDVIADVDVTAVADVGGKALFCTGGLCDRIIVAVTEGGGFSDLRVVTTSAVALLCAIVKTGGCFGFVPLPKVVTKGRKLIIGGIVAA